MTLHELRRRAEDTAKGWFVRADLASPRDISGRDALFIEAASPATVLKLLEIIAVLRQRHKRIVIDPLFARSESEHALKRAEELERSL